MAVRHGVDQLDIDPEPGSLALHRAFHDSRNAEFPSYLRHRLCRSPITQDGGPGNHLQLADSGHVGQDVVMNSCGEGIGLIVAAHIDKRQNGERFFGRTADGGGPFTQVREPVNREDQYSRNQYANDDEIDSTSVSPAARQAAIHLFFQSQAFGGQFQKPRSDQGQGKAHRQQNKHQGQTAFGQTQDRKRDISNLQNQPGGNGVCHRHSKNVTLLQLVEKVSWTH